MKAEALALLALTALAIAGLRSALRKWRDWRSYIMAALDTTREAIQARTSGAGIKLWLLSPVIFAGFYAIVLGAWLVTLAIIGTPVVLLALLVVCPGSIIAWNAARCGSRLIRRFA